MTKQGRSLWNAREASAQGVKRRIAGKFEAKMSESQAKQITMQVGRKLATKTKKDRNGKDEDGDGVDGVMDFQIAALEGVMWLVILREFAYI